MKKRITKKMMRRADGLQAVLDLQRDMSFAEQVATAIIGMTEHRDNPEWRNIPVLLNCSKSCSGIFDSAANAVRKKMMIFDTLEEENRELRKKLECK